MKIEKLNDNQIRCTLTRADLADRQLKLSELVCGSEKAKSLFQDMMKQAASEFGFEAEDMPLMIEAVPTSPDSIVLIITKVDNPEELDSRFSKLGTPLHELDNKKHSIQDKLEGADDILELINKVKEAVAKPPKAKEIKKAIAKDSKIRLFSFSSLDSVINACRLLRPIYHGSNTLYKDAQDHVYILAITQSDHTQSEFHKINNMLSEFGSAEKSTGVMLAFLEEHCDIIVPADAVQQLGEF